MRRDISSAGEVVHPRSRQYRPLVSGTNRLEVKLDKQPATINQCEAFRYAESVRSSVEHVWRLAARLHRTA